MCLLIIKKFETDDEFSYMRPGEMLVCVNVCKRTPFMWTKSLWQTRYCRCCQAR